jgi:hypothetical protein
MQKKNAQCDIPEYSNLIIIAVTTRSPSTWFFPQTKRYPEIKVTHSMYISFTLTYLIASKVRYEFLQVKLALTK